MRKLTYYFQAIKQKLWVTFYGVRLARFEEIAYSKKQLQVPQQKQLPYLKYHHLEQYIQKFMNSKSQNGRVNGQHLTLVTGGQNYGKTTFIKDNIAKFIAKKNKLKVDRKHTSKNQYDIFNTPQFFQDERRINVVENPNYILIKFDYGLNGTLNFQGFLFMFQNTILKELKKVIEDFPPGYILNADIVKQVVLASKCQQYLYVYVKDAIYSILHGNDTLQLKDQNLQALQQFNQELKDNDISCTEFFNGKYYNELIKILNKQLKNNQWETALQFFLSCMRRIEYQYRPIEFQNTWYESGIQTIGLLFDLLDFLCGVGKLNHKIVLQYYNPTRKSGQTNTKNSNNHYNFYMKYKDTYILSGNHIDTILCMMNLQELQCFKNRDPRFMYFYDNILIRYCASKSNLRHHFPIIIEVPHTPHLRQIQNLGRFGLQNPVNLQIPGYIHFFLDSTQLPRILSHKTIDKLWNVNGRSPKIWNDTIKQLAEGIPIQNILLGTTKNVQQSNIKFDAKLNHLYLHPQNLQLIDNNTLKYQLLYLLKMTSKVKGLFDIYRPYYNLLFFDRPLFQSMLKQNIFFNHAYINSMQLCDARNIFGVRNRYGRDIKQYGYKYRLWRIGKTSYYFRKKQISYTIENQKVAYKQNQQLLERRQLHVRYYFGPGDDYQFLYKQYGVDYKLVLI